MLFYSYCITWQNTLFFFQKFQLLANVLFIGFSLKDIHDKILQPKKIFQRDRVSDVVLVGFLSVFGFTFIHLLTTAERKNYAVEGSRCINLSAGMPMNRTFAERLKLLKDFWGHSSREGCFSSKDGYAYQKEGGKTLKTCRKMSQFL